MDLNTLKEEHKKYKKALKTFIILEIVSYVIFIISFIGLYIGIIFLAYFSMEGNSQITEDQLGVIAVVFTLGSTFILMISAMATEAFIPFIIVSAIKLGKRNNKIKELEREEPQLV